MQADDRLLLISESPSPAGDTSGMAVQHLLVPQHYLSTNYPIAHAALSADGVFCVFCVYCMCFVVCVMCVELCMHMYCDNTHTQQHTHLTTHTHSNTHTLKHTHTHTNTHSGSDIAVAGKHGLALYSRRSGRWRVFGDVSQERDLHVQALLWLPRIIVAVAQVCIYVWVYCVCGCGCRYSISLSLPHTNIHTFGGYTP